MFQGVEKGCIGNKWVNADINKSLFKSPFSRMINISRCELPFCIFLSLFQGSRRQGSRIMSNNYIQYQCQDKQKLYQLLSIFFYHLSIYLLTYLSRHSLKYGPRTRDPGHRTRDPGPETRDPGPRTRDPGPRIWDP